MIFYFQIIKKDHISFTVAHTSCLPQQHCPHCSTFRLHGIFMIVTYNCKSYCGVTWWMAVNTDPLQHASLKVHLQQIFPWSGFSLCPAIFLRVPQLMEYSQFPRCGSKLDSSCEIEQQLQLTGSNLTCILLEWVVKV